MLHDPLTQLPTRTLFSDRLEQAMALAGRRRDRLALLYIALPGFPRGAGGETAADKLTVQLARRIKADLRASDSVCRLDAAEFLVLLQEAGNAEAVAAVAEELAMHIRRPLLVEGQEYALEARIGCALYPDHGEDERSLVDAARRDAAGEPVSA